MTLVETHFLNRLYLHFFTPSLHLLHEDYCTLNFHPLGPNFAVSTMCSLIQRAIQTLILKARTNTGILGAIDNYSRIQCRLHYFTLRRVKTTTIIVKENHMIENLLLENNTIIYLFLYHLFLLLLPSYSCYHWLDSSSSGNAPRQLLSGTFHNFNMYIQIVNKYIHNCYVSWNIHHRDRR